MPPRPANRPDVAAAKSEVDGGEVTAFALLADGTACALGAKPRIPRG